MLRWPKVYSCIIVPSGKRQREGMFLLALMNAASSLDDPRCRQGPETLSLAAPAFSELQYHRLHSDCPLHSYGCVAAVCLPYAAIVPAAISLAQRCCESGVRIACLPLYPYSSASARGPDVSNTVVHCTCRE